MLKRFLSAIVIDTLTNDFSGNDAKVELINSNSLLTGIAIGVITTLCIIGIIKYFKWITKEPSKTQEELNEKSDK